MLLPKIVYRKYNLNGFNNPTDFFLGIKNRIPKRKRNCKRIYFIDAPEHSNMGDQAIAVAMVEFLSKFKEYEVLVFPISHLLENILPIKLDCKKDDIIVLVGGGIMGVEYFTNEEARRVAIEAFLNNKIVVFPQTIDYGKTDYGKTEFEKSIKIYSKHNNLHIFAREEASYEIIKGAYKYNYLGLVPDIVLSMNYHRNLERKGILQCIRKDRESALSKEQYLFIVSLLKKIGEVKKIDTVETAIPIIISESIRKKLLYRKLDQFAGSEFVVTDRLHGMIFSVITNTPCFVLPTYNYKVVSCYETWLKKCDNVFFVDNLNDLEYEIRIKLDNNEKRKGCNYSFYNNYKLLEECFKG